jgi:hypothetical protein
MAKNAKPNFGDRINDVHVRFELKGTGWRVVKEKDGLKTADGVEEAIQVAFGLPNVLRYDAGKIDLVEVEAEVICQDFGAHGLAASGRPGKEHAKAVVGTGRLSKTPLSEHDVTMAKRVGDFLELSQDGRRQNQVIPGEPRRDLARQAS